MYSLSESTRLSFLLITCDALFSDKRIGGILALPDTKDTGWIFAPQRGRDREIRSIYRLLDRGDRRHDSFAAFAIR
jgi:hypothetical protein